MRRRSVLWLSVVIAAAVATQAAASGSAATSTANRRFSVTEKLRLPAPDSARLVLLMVHVTESRGAVGSLTIQGHDEAALPSGIRAFAAVHPRTSKRRSATFEIYVGVNNLTPGAAGDAHASSAPTDLEFRIRGVGRYTLDEIDYPLPPTDRECTKLNHLGANADDPTFSFEYFDLARQASAGEAVLDHVIHDRYKCPGSEVPEPGEGPG